MLKSRCLSARRRLDVQKYRRKVAMECSEGLCLRYINLTRLVPESDEHTRKLRVFRTLQTGYQCLAPLLRKSHLRVRCFFGKMKWSRVCCAGVSEIHGHWSDEILALLSKDPGSTHTMWIALLLQKCQPRRPMFEVSTASPIVPKRTA